MTSDLPAEQGLAGLLNDAWSHPTAEVFLRHHPRQARGGYFGKRITPVLLRWGRSPEAPGATYRALAPDDRQAARDEGLFRKH
jgi:hypothetical protein